MPSTSQQRQPAGGGEAGGAERHHQHRHQVEPGRVVQPGYLDKYLRSGDKNKLLQRLKTLVSVLQEDSSIEPDSPDWPGLGSTATLLVEKFVQHRDKEVRLYATLACMELLAIVSTPSYSTIPCEDPIVTDCRSTLLLIFYVDPNLVAVAFLALLQILQYAPDCPFDEPELIIVFQQIITQLANLANVTDPKKPNYKNYFRILELLATVKMGIVLVELTKTASDDDQLPLETLADLIRTLLHVVRNGHPQEVQVCVQEAVVACLDEYEGEHHAHAVPIPLLDELLLCIGQGPTQWVVNPNPQAQLAAAAAAAKNKMSNGKISGMMVEEPNPSFLAAASIVQTCINRIATPISQLLNGLLNGDSYVVEQSSIQAVAASVASASERKSDPDDADSTLPWPKDSVYTIVYEMLSVSPEVLTTVIGTLSNGLCVPDTDTRAAVVELLGRLFCSPSKVSTSPTAATAAINAEKSMAGRFHVCFREWVSRKNDLHRPIRLLVSKYCVRILKDPGNYNTGMGVEDQAIAALDHLLSDPDSDVRLETIQRICNWAFRASGNTPEVPAKLLRTIGKRNKSKCKDERKGATTALAQIYFRRFVVPRLEAVQAGGDDCDLAVILRALRENCQSLHPAGSRHRRPSQTPSNRLDQFSFGDDYDFNAGAEEAFCWIPSIVFEAASFTDSIDSDMRSRVVQLVDEVLLGSSLSNKTKKLSDTARAVGLTMVLDSLVVEGDCILTTSTETVPLRGLNHLFGQRSKLQTALGSYIDARAEANDCESGKNVAAVIQQFFLICVSPHSFVEWHSLHHFRSFRHRSSFGC